MAKKRKPDWDEFSLRALAAYARRWGHGYNRDFDDSGWWKWFDGYECGRREALREKRKRKAESESGGQPPQQQLP